MDLWKELHERALNFKGKDDTAFLINFGHRIPRYTKGCACKEHWRVILKENPPKFGEEYFEWSVNMHNLVNKKLGKPTYTVEEARKFYEKK
jgi:hypothetical protein